MIIVTGATGRLGAGVVSELRRRTSVGEVGVSVRNVSQAKDLAQAGVRVRRGDFTDPGSLQHAFEGADQVLVVSAAIRGPGAAAANQAAIRAAVAAGATRVLYTSHQAASLDSLFAAQHQHAATETFLAEQGVTHCALRHGFYASTFEIFLPRALETGELRLPQDGPVSWTSHQDLAEADALTLLQPDRWTGASPPLASTEQLDFADVARIASELTGRRMTRVVVEDEEWRATAIAAGMPALAADFTLGMFRAARAGEFAVTDLALEHLLARPVTPARAAVRAAIGPGR